MHCIIRYVGRLNQLQLPRDWDQLEPNALWTTFTFTAQWLIIWARFHFLEDIGGVTISKIVSVLQKMPPW